MAYYIRKNIFVVYLQHFLFKIKLTGILTLRVFSCSKIIDGGLGNL